MPVSASIRLATLLALSGLIAPLAATAQDAGGPASKTEAMQIGQRDGAATTGEARRRVVLDEAPATRTRTSLMQAEGDQIGTPEGAGAAPQQLTASGESARRMPQLSEAQLEATLAQLTPAERSVLLQAIEGSDICDNPPAVAAIVALCRTRLETRAAEFAAPPEKPLTAEERLLRGGLESNGLPSVEAVIARLSKVTVAAASEDFSNQAIASIALAPPLTADKPAKEEDPAGLGLGQETEALINAIVQQLGGQGGGRP
jgi:hypothetical protein